MWTEVFLEKLAESIAKNNIFMGYEGLEQVQPRGQAIWVHFEVDTEDAIAGGDASAGGYVDFLYRYPEGFVQVKADLYIGSQVAESYVKRFPFPKSILVAYRLGGGGSALLKQLADEVAEWVAYVQE